MSGVVERSEGPRSSRDEVRVIVISGPFGGSRLKDLLGAMRGVRGRERPSNVVAGSVGGSGLGDLSKGSSAAVESRSVESSLLVVNLPVTSFGEPAILDLNIRLFAQNPLTGMLTIYAPATKFDDCEEISKIVLSTGILRALDGCRGISPGEFILSAKPPPLPTDICVPRSHHLRALATAGTEAVGCFWGPSCTRRWRTAYC